MSLRFISAALLITATGLAQVDVPKPKPATPPEKAAPPVVQEKTSGQIITELRTEKERLLSEIEYAKERAKNASTMLSSKLGRRGQTFRSIDAGVTQPVRPAMQQPQKARVQRAGEDGGFEPGVLLVVDGQPIQEAEFDSMMNYLRAQSTGGDDNMRANRVLFELIRDYSVAAKFPENEAQGQIAECYAQIQQGSTLAELAGKYGTVLGAKEDGAVTVTRNSFLGTKVEMTAFSLKEGEYSNPIRNIFGFVVIGVDKIEKGEKPELDKISAHAVQVRFATDDATLSQAQAAPARGQVTVIARDQEVLDLLPPLFRPVSDVAPTRLQQLTTQLQAIEAQITDLQANTDAGDRLQALKKERDAIRAALKQLTPPTDEAGPDRAPIKRAEVIKKGGTQLKPKKR